MMLAVADAVAVACAMALPVLISNRHNMLVLPTKTIVFILLHCGIAFTNFITIVLGIINGVLYSYISKK
jgi:hypothetical protein